MNGIIFLGAWICGSVGGIVSLFLKAVLALLLLLPISAQAVEITVNPSSTIKTSPTVPLGVAFNQIVDGTLSLDSLKAVVVQSGSKYLRFPEGESADNYFFTDPIYLSNPKPSTARVANTKYWPVGTALANSNGTLPKGLNFDQFMSVVATAKATANVVLCYPCGDKIKALEMARAWVKYSKDKGYNVLNWEIGNETFIFNPNYTDEYEMTAAEYAKDIVEWSAALKAIDPRIKIGVNGKTKEWLSTLLTYKHPSLNRYGAQSIDFLAIHSYPLHGSDFAAYQQNRNAYGTLNFAHEVNFALAALQSSASIASTSHIKISITECSTMNYSSSGDLNNMGSALMTADMLTELLKQPRVDYVQLWASRWVKGLSMSTPQGADTFSPKNTLNPSGKALAVLAQFTREKIVSSIGDTTTLKVFSSVTSDGALSVMLLNRSETSQNVVLKVLGASSLTGKKHSFTASSVTSISPTFDSTGMAVKSATGTLNISVPKTSFVILNFTGVTILPPPAIKNYILNPSFESGLTNWSDWGNSSVVASNATSGTYSLRLGVGAGGRAQTISGLRPVTSYVFSGKGKVTTANEKAWFGVTFYDVNGAKISGSDISVPITSSNYQMFSLRLTAPANFASAQVWVWKEAGSGYVYCDELNFSP